MYEIKERKRESRISWDIYEKGDMKSSLNCFFFVLLSWDWCRSNLNFARHPFLFFWHHTQFRLQRAYFFIFLFASQYYLETFNHLSFLILANLIQPSYLSIPQPWVVWHKVKRLFCRLLCSHPRVENLQWLYNFPDAHAILVSNHPSRMPPTQFTWYFRCVLFTLRQVYILVGTHVTYVACQEVF